METKGINALMSEYNCRHVKFPVVVRVTPPMYSEEELAELEAVESVKHEYNGKRYTLYELTQLRDRYNRQIKANFNKAAAWDAAGNADKLRQKMEQLFEAARRQNEIAVKADTASGKKDDGLDLSFLASGLDFSVGLISVLTENLRGHFLVDLAAKMFGLKLEDIPKPDGITNDSAYYLGRLLGDIVSIAVSGAEGIIGAFTILTSIFGGGAVTLSSGGTLTVGGIAIGAAGVTVGGALVVDAATGVWDASVSFREDWDNFVKAQGLGEVSNGGNVISSDETASKIINAKRTGSALKTDIYHRSATYLTEEQLSKGKTFNITGGDGVQRTLLQVEGELNGKGGIFEYILNPDGTVSHQIFKIGGKINGIPN